MTTYYQNMVFQDLGYFCLDEFEEMERRGAFYVSRLKLNIRVYENNEEMESFKDGKVKKQSLYKEIDLEDVMNRLQPREMAVLSEVYLGRYKKFRTRLLIYKLTEEQTQKRLLIRAKQEKKKNITYKSAQSVKVPSISTDQYARNLLKKRKYP
ncbi:hypothetical protein [Halalkalibacter lacteus]|uniref:hypothetical protein n=1 Tax=Halalkalibacter lacteus TaxID=3090663 RepID=UPI002FC9FF3D